MTPVQFGKHHPVQSSSPSLAIIVVPNANTHLLNGIKHNLGQPSRDTVSFGCKSGHCA